MDLNQLHKHILATYFMLRVGMGLMALLLPIILWPVGAFVGIEPLGSMSAYYHTDLRDIFVGVLFALGSFLYLYKGFSPQENRALNIAGVAAVGVALFPTASKLQTVCETPTAPFLHGLSAVLFFLAIAYVCIRLGPQTLSLIEDDTTRRRFRVTYRLLGVAMIALPTLAVILLFLLKQSHSVVFAVEALAVWTFAAYWLVKSWEFRKTETAV